VAARHSPKLLVHNGHFALPDRDQQVRQYSNLFLLGWFRSSPARRVPQRLAEVHDSSTGGQVVVPEELDLVGELRIRTRVNAT
jgi:hypothetical protein